MKAERHGDLLASERLVKKTLARLRKVIDTDNCSKVSEDSGESDTVPRAHNTQLILWSWSCYIASVKQCKELKADTHDVAFSFTRLSFE